MKLWRAFGVAVLVVVALPGFSQYYGDTDNSSATYPGYPPTPSHRGYAASDSGSGSSVSSARGRRSATAEVAPSAQQPEQEESGGLFGLKRLFRGKKRAAQPREYKKEVIDDPNNPRSSAVPELKYEDNISPNEQPSARGAMTVPAAAGQGTSELADRRINFPRDRADDVDVLKLQVYLDYHGYSPGEIDGQWGYNTERALYVYQKNNGMPQTGQLDDRMLARLDQFKEGYLLDYTVTENSKAIDNTSILHGSYKTIPRDYYAQASWSYLPYESAVEALGEVFHCSSVLLKKLNPGVDFDRLQAGQHILGLNTPDGIDETRHEVAVVRISKHNKWIEAFDSQGRHVFYYPSTLGSMYDPLPLGEFKVIGVSQKPTFEYQPKLFWDADHSKPNATIPPGPNNPCGVVWIGTSRKSVGIHGTPNPENVSKNTSHGCIRMTNWDAVQLSKRVKEGTKLEFVP